MDSITKISKINIEDDSQKKGSSVCHAKKIKLAISEPLTFKIMM